MSTQVRPPIGASDGSARPSSGRRRLPWRPDAVDAAALRLWLLTRVAVLAVVSAGAWLVATDDDARDPVGFLDRWLQWDTHHYVTIARWGYDGDPQDPPDDPLIAFFPGFPLALRAVHELTRLDYVAAGLLISLIAGAIAIVALARIAALEAGRAAGPALVRGVAPAPLAERTVLLFLLAPSAVFLTAAYTEALFLAFALPAWLAARRGNWAAAGLLAAGACTVRVSGVFLAAALVVEFLTTRDGSGKGRRRWSSTPWLLVPALPVLGYVTYLHQRTGDWLAWQHAQETGWYRSFHWPWEAFANTWRNAFGERQSTGFAWMFGAEILAVALGLVLTVWLLRRARWAEAVYIGLQVWAFSTSYWFFSVPRATLLWWPLWIALAAWTLRRPVALQAYLALIAPLMIVFVLLFSTGRWAG